MSSRRWQVVIASPAARDIDRLPMKVAAAALEAIHSIAANPRRMGKPLHLELKGQWSARRGPYRIIYLGSSGNCVGDRVEIQTTAMEVDGGLEVLAIAEAAGGDLDRLDAGVE